MKTRQGFVSNSSSSSFLIYGICVEDIDQCQFDEICGEKQISFSDYDKDLDSWSPYGYDCTFVGIEWDQVKDDETGLEFKNRTTEAVKKFAKDFEIEIPQKLNTLSEAWYNG